MSTLTLVATIQQPDPCYERDGPLFSLSDLRALAALPAGTKLYTTSSTPEEAHQLEADRDTKAANLQLLVDKVLDYKEAVESAVGGPGHIDTYKAERLLDDTVALARSLKQ